MVKNEEIVSDDVKVANTLNTFFLTKFQQNLLITTILVAYRDTQLLAEKNITQACMPLKDFPNVCQVLFTSSTFFLPVNKNTVL